MERKDDRVPVTLLTGFLGAGKTPLLNHLIRDPQAGRIAVVMNEFGDVGLDHDLIEETASIPAWRAAFTAKAGARYSSLRPSGYVPSPSRYLLSWIKLKSLSVAACRSALLASKIADADLRSVITC